MSISHTSDGKILVRNASFWMKIDPVSDRFIGDDIQVTGTTNFPEGTEILSELYITRPPCRMKVCQYDPNTYSNRTIFTVKPGSNGDHTFTVLFPTNNLMLREDYFYLITPLTTELYGEDWFYSDRFELFPHAAKSEVISSINSLPSFHEKNEKTWIWINPAPDESQRRYEFTRMSHFNVVRGESYVQISGLTNLPAGDKIPYSIISNLVLDDRNPDDVRKIDLSGDFVSVTSGQNPGTNKFDLYLNASSLPSEGRLITFWNPRYNKSLNDDFLSSSIWFTFNDSLIPTPPKTTRVIPTSGSSVDPGKTQSSLSFFGTSLSLMLVCIFSYRIRNRKN